MFLSPAKWWALVTNCTLRDWGWGGDFLFAKTLYFNFHSSGEMFFFVLDILKKAHIETNKMLNTQARMVSMLLPQFHLQGQLCAKVPLETKSKSHTATGTTHGGLHSNGMCP